MRKIVLPAFLALILTNCGRDEGSLGGSARTPLIVGKEDQPGVVYNDDVGSINFELNGQEGDSTFYIANLDLDINSSNDLVFTLTKWTNNQVLTLRARSGYEIPFSGSEFEILGTEVTIPGLNLLNSGIQIDSRISNYQSLTDGFITNTRNNSVSTSANLSIWNDVVYVPFRSSSKEGWIGIYIVSNTDVEIDAIGIDMIAIR